MSTRPRRRRSRLSWFPFFPDNWLGGTATLSDTESGRYLLLLCAQWASAERTSVPADPARLRIICRGGDPGEAVLSKFGKVEVDGVLCLRNERLADLWTEAFAEYTAKRLAAERGSEHDTERTAKRSGERAAKRPEDRRKKKDVVVPLTPVPSEPPSTGEPPPAVADSGNGKQKPWNQRACDPVVARYGGTAPGARITRALRPLVARHGEDPVLEAWARYVDETEAEYLSPERFATTFSRWARSGPRSLGDGCATAAKPVDPEVVERVEARKRLAATCLRAPGESAEQYVRRLDAALEAGA